MEQMAGEPLSPPEHTIKPIHQLTPKSAGERSGVELVTPSHLLNKVNKKRQTISCPLRWKTL